MTTQKEVEELLGRKMKSTEKMIFKMYHNDDNWVFSVDKYGNLTGRKK